MLKHMVMRIACVLFIAALLPATVAAIPPGGDAQAGPSDGMSEAATSDGAGEETQQEIPPVETKLYELQHVSLSSAYEVASSACREIPADQRRYIDCNVSVMEEEGTLIVTSTAAVHSRVATLLSEVDKPPHTQSFHIIVLAATDSPSTPSSLPPGAQRAVEDIKEFLPYAGFRVLDTGWLKTARYGQTTLTGPTGFEVSLVFRGDPRSKEPLLIEDFTMTVMEPAVVLPEGVQGETRGARQRRVLTTSFSMSVGETVVVGTSKLNGNNEPTALVILLTALEQEEAR
jgi:hypothetical protein